MAAFKRFYKGDVVGETYTGLDQTDFAPEMAKIRAAKPDVVYQFEPGGLGIAFMRQYQQADLLKEIPIVVHPASLDQAIVQAVGDAAAGVQVTSHWNEDFDNPVNAAFVKAWKAKYPDRPITYYAAQGYDAALMIGVGLEKSPDGVNNAAAFRKALLTSDIPTVRGKISLWPEPTSGSGLVRADRCEGTGWQDGPENGKESFYRSWRHLRRRMQDEGA